MHKTTTLKDFNVFMLKACLTTLILGFSFSVSFAQKQSATSAKPISAEQRKQAQAANDANASAAFSDAVKNEAALKSTPASVDATSADKSKAEIKSVGKYPNTVKPAPTSERSAADITKKKAGQNAAVNAEPIKRTKGN